MTERNGREEDANFREAWVTTEEAARLLSVSVRTIQKRAREGKLPSRLAGPRKIEVCVPVRDSETDVRETSDSVRDSSAALIARYESEIAFLRTRIEKHETAESELRRLMLEDKRELQELRQRLAIEAAPTEPPESRPAQAETTQETPGVQKDTRSFWQRFFRRG